MTVTEDFGALTVTGQCCDVYTKGPHVTRHVPFIGSFLFKTFSAKVSQGKSGPPLLWLEEEMSAEDMASQGATCHRRLRTFILQQKIWQETFSSTSTSRLQIIAPCQTWAKQSFKWFSLLWCQMGKGCFLQCVMSQDNHREVSLLSLFTILHRYRYLSSCCEAICCCRQDRTLKSSALQLHRGQVSFVFMPLVL